MHSRPESARLRLRAGTADCHERVDALFSSANLANRDGYAHFLQAQASAFLAAEHRLEAASIDKLLQDWPSRRRSHLIVQDLAALGVPVPDRQEAPAPRGVPEMLGWVYVLEGSRLGGKLLRRDVPAELPIAFLSDSYPDGWRSLAALLDQQLTDESAIDQAVNAARTLFAVFERSGEQMKARRKSSVA